MAVREPLDIRRPLVASTSFIFAGEQYEKGDKFPRGDVRTFSPRLIKRQYEALRINHPPAEPEDEGPVTIRTAPRNGSYVVNAPWLDEPETIRGKVNAETRYAELVNQGPPLGWIEGGSEVEVEGGEGGWYTVTAPWLDAPERVQGRDAAEARQRELHEAGAPEVEQVDHPEVLVSVGDGVWTVTAPWLGEPEPFDSEDAAAERQTALRAEGPPDGWSPPTGDGEPEAGSGEK